MQIYLKRDMLQTVCIYFFYFVTGGCKKLVLVQGPWKSNSEFGNHEKVNEAWGLQKVIGDWRQDQTKVR